MRWSFIITGALAGAAYARCITKSSSARFPSSLAPTMPVSVFQVVAALTYSSVVAAAPSSLSTAVASGTSSSSTSTSTGGFWWFGVSESVAEFGKSNVPGTYGIDYEFPNTSTIKTLISEGYNIFRIPFLMERMVPHSITASLSEGYLKNYSAVVDFVTSNGAYAVLEPHNFGRYNGDVITSTSDFKTFWTTLAKPFKSNSKVIFDTNNEYHDEDESNVVAMNQASIDAIRAAGATSQYIFVEGNAYTGAWSWTSENTAMKSLTDPQDKIIYEMHQYLDSDNSGTSSICVSSTIGKERVQSATQWLKSNKKLGIIGEFAGGPNEVCKQAVTDMLDYLQENSDVWLGAMVWAAGPWWGTENFSYEPPSGTQYKYYNSALKTYLPSQKGNGSLRSFPERSA